MDIQRQIDRERARNLQIQREEREMQGQRNRDIKTMMIQNQKYIEQIERQGGRQIYRVRVTETVKDGDRDRGTEIDTVNERQRDTENKLQKKKEKQYYFFLKIFSMLFFSLLSNYATRSQIISKVCLKKEPLMETEIQFDGWA